MIQPDNQIVTITRSEIVKEEALPSSAMPAFDRVMSAADLAALIAWLTKS